MTEDRISGIIVGSNAVCAIWMLVHGLSLLARGQYLWSAFSVVFMFCNLLAAWLCWRKK